MAYFEWSDEGKIDIMAVRAAMDMRVAIVVGLLTHCSRLQRGGGAAQNHDEAKRDIA